jgi:hypothetical protein
MKDGTQLSCKPLPAHCKDYRTGIILEMHKTYRIRAVAAPDLKDKTISCPSANGFLSSHPEKAFARFILRKTERFRRVPSASWFCLIAYIHRAGLPLGKAHRASYQMIGSEAVITPDYPGELICFLNDLPCMYSNNSGSVKLEITEL